MSQNHIKRIAIVGANGQSGSFMAEALIKSGRFEVTALTRADSNSTMPEGLNSVVKVDYNDPSSITAALKGQDCLIITMSVMAPPDTSSKLIKAAAEAGVPWVLPNEWGGDHLNPVVAKESMIGEPIIAMRKLITDLGVSSYIAVCCSFWYEYSMTAGDWAYGFNWADKKVTLYGNGEIPINTSTWPKVGAAVASLLSLPINREGADGPCLDDFRNKCCYVSSFRLTQKEMFESLLRVTGDKESDWTVEYEDPQERYARGLKIMQGGNRAGFGMCLYSRLFFPDSPGNYEARGIKLHNDVLGLEQEDLDTRTKVAVEMFKTRKPLM